MRPTRWLFLAWFAALAGCSSAPPVNYTLSRPVPQGAATLPAVKSGPYALGEVIVPPEVDHAELVAFAHQHLLVVGRDFILTEIAQA